MKREGCIPLAKELSFRTKRRPLSPLYHMFFLSNMILYQNELILINGKGWQ
jgi:hypothetical protein